MLVAAITRSLLATAVSTVALTATVAATNHDRSEGATGPIHGLGLIADPARPVTRAAADAIRAASVVPAAVDLTASAPPVGDQRAVNACAAWSTDYTALGYWLRRDDRRARALAPMYSYSQVNGGVDKGSSLDANLEIAETQGIDARSDYRQGDYDWKDQPTSSERANATRWKLGSVQTLPVSPVGSVTELAIKEALAAGNPVAVVAAVVLNVTVTGAAGSGNVAVHADGTAAPGTSNVNSSAGRPVANLVIVPPGADGKVALTTQSPGPTQIIVGVAGYVLGR